MTPLGRRLCPGLSLRIAPMGRSIDASSSPRHSRSRWRFPFEGVRRVQFDTNRTPSRVVDRRGQLTERTLAFVSRLGPTKGKATIYFDDTKVASIDL